MFFIIMTQTYESRKIIDFKNDFIEKNIEKYQKKELLILSKVLINIKFKNCVYHRNIYDKVKNFL